MCPDLIKMAPKSKVRTFLLFLDVMFFFFSGKFGQKWCLTCALIFRNVPKMRRNAVVFLEVISLELFSGKFREIWAKILRTHKHLPAPAPMHYVSLRLTTRQNYYMPGSSHPHRVSASCIPNGKDKAITSMQRRQVCSSCCMTVDVAAEIRTSIQLSRNTVLALQ